MSDSKQKTLEVKVTASETNGVLTFEGSVSVPGLAKTKLANKDGITKFETLSALKGVARRVTERNGYGVTYDETSVQRRLAAKRSSSSKKTTSSATTPTV
jgi:hypothetical protein